MQHRNPRQRLAVRNRLVGFAFVAAGLLMGLHFGCSGAPSAFLVNGPGQLGDIPPTLSIVAPNASISRGQGDPFLIQWTDTDPDSNASISFSLVNIVTNALIPLVQGIDENDQTGPDSFTVLTRLIPVGSYNILGVINDRVNPPVQVFAQAEGPTNQRVIVQILGAGEGQQTEPPVVVVTAPVSDLSVTQDDPLTVIVQPVANQTVPPTPFDEDSDVTLYIVLDTDLDPGNDDPANPQPGRIVVLRTQQIAEDATEVTPFVIPIDLNQVPPRANGEPYFIRATVDDGTNERVHSYAAGTISVVQLAAGTVDLSQAGRSLAGALWLGFNPGANVGSTVRGVRDFDNDGTDDFVIVAQFGNPRNFGLVGEAYLIYGQDHVRLGGVLPVNSVGQTISGAIFEAPPVRTTPSSPPGTVSGRGVSDGITDVNFLPDLTGDGRPELIFGLAHVEGAFDTMDFDPSDDDLSNEDSDLEIVVTIRQGQVTVSEGGGTPDITSTTYDGVVDTFISSAQPSNSFGGNADISWVDGGANNQRWGLIKFQDVLDQLPDDPAAIDFSNFTATLTVRVFNTGDPGNVHTLLTDFTEQTRYNNFAVNGADPQAGVDYLGDPGGGGELATIDASTAGEVEVEVTDILRQLIDGQLGGFDNEVRFIIVSEAGGANDAAIRSSEFNIQPDRPTLTITYNRLNLVGGGIGCFPDQQANNQSDPDDNDPFDVQFFGGGMAVIVNSTNRDNQGGIPAATRLDNTAVALELVGQRGNFALNLDGFDFDGNIVVRADNSTADVIGGDDQQTGRIAGARIVSGPFDFIDHRFLNQPAREDSFAQSVGSMGDVNNDRLPEIIISSPTNERHLRDLFDTYGFQSTHWFASDAAGFKGSITVIPGANYNAPIWRDIADSTDGTSTLPFLDHHLHGPFGRCTNPTESRHQDRPTDTFEIFAENVDDRLGGARSAGDFNQDGLDDIVCGAPLNDRSGAQDAGAVYVLYSRSVLADFLLDNAEDPVLRTPMLRIRGLKRGDQIGWRQGSGLDINGDRLDDVFFSSPRTDFGGVSHGTCGRDFNSDGTVDSADFSLSRFNDCLEDFGDEVFSDDNCKAFDYDNDTDVDADDRCVFCCLSGDCDPESACVLGREADCCANLVDNGFVGIVFGGRFIDGDRNISQIATTELPGAIFFGGSQGDRAGMDISSAGDFNQDGFGDILIAAPGEIRVDNAGRQRLGVVYLVFGGTHLENTRWNLSDPNRGVGSEELPGIVFMSPFVMGRPNEAAPVTVGFLGDINNDGFGDIAIGNPKADFIDLSFPQGPDAPGSDAAAGRRSDAGNVYIIYGNNFGSNRANP